MMVEIKKKKKTEEKQEHYRENQKEKYVRGYERRKEGK